ncbi:hypothetical protein HID58_001368, partial [Brassica napus]
PTLAPPAKHSRQLGAQLSGSMSFSSQMSNEDEEMSRTTLSAIRAKEEEIEKNKMEIRERVQAQLGRVEEETKRLALIREVISYSSPTSAGAECIDSDCFWVEQRIHRAGPREKIYFRPEQVKAAIITCGGLCPGLNDVIRHIVITLEIYGVKNIVGISFGYKGFSDKDLTEMPLSRKVVQNIHLSGGSLLGVSRGGPSVSEIVDSMEERGINMLFVLGGNGTHAGANAIHNECRKRKMKVAVVGVPKTIDNDILHMDKTFGFDTAVEEAQRAINSAYIEAHSAYHGIGIVKLMGRNSGFIAMQASLASGQVDICLIPEVPFNIHGPNGVLKHMKYLIETKGSAVICVAEGAGQNLLEKTNAKDASGNTILGDFGVHIRQEDVKRAVVPAILDVGGMDTPIPNELLDSVDVLSSNETELSLLTGKHTETFEQFSQAVAISYQSEEIVIRDVYIINENHMCCRHHSTFVEHLSETI